MFLYLIYNLTFSIQKPTTLYSKQKPIQKPVNVLLLFSSLHIATEGGTYNKIGSAQGGARI